MTTTGNDNDINRDKAFSVAEITKLIKITLEGTFPPLSIEGELTNFRPSGAGHWYFSLKDDQAMIQGVMFKYRSSLVGFMPKEGMKVIVRGSISVYAQRGAYQVVCDTMEEAGQGTLLALIEQRKKALAAEGLFDASRKKELPLFPAKIAVVTSPTGAAIRDILQVIGRRNSGLDVVILPAAVQGDEAGLEIAAQIRRANMFALGDVIIVGRGGGSLEDLLPFSDEAVVRAIADSDIPVISAVGHETDMALIDFAADVRAPTPSAAAEIVTGSREELHRHITGLQQDLKDIIERRCERIRLLLERFTPDYLEQQCRRLVQPYSQRLDDAQEELIYLIHDHIRVYKHKFELLKSELRGNSPLEIMGRGYAIVSRWGNDEIITSSQSVQPKEQLRVRLAAGRLKTQIIDIEHTAISQSNEKEQE